MAVKPKGKKRGRPTKYRDNFPMLLLESFGQGYSYEAFAGHPDVRVCLETLYTWEKEYPEFLEAKKEGLSVSRRIWENLGREGMMGQICDFNATVWIFNMKNRFGWRDKQEIENTHKIEKSFHMQVVDAIHGKVDDED